jgi:ribosomal protein S6
MKLRTRHAVFFTTMILGVIISLAGCATTGMQRSTKTSTTMEAVENEYKQAVAQVDATGASLEDLVKQGQSEVKEAFKKYSANVDKMEDMGKRLFEHADNMSAEGKWYFEEWRMQGNTYTNPQIRALSEQRRADLSAIFAKISEASVGVKGAFKAYMSDIREIQTYLSNDLTPKGVEAITPIAQKAVKDGDSLKDAVNPVLSAIGTARKELVQGGAK